MTPWTQCPLGAASVFVPPLGLLGRGCLEGGVAQHMGIMQSRYEGYSPPPRPAGPFAYCFYHSTATFHKALVQSAALRCGLDGGFAAACSKMLA
jgi:hypothetical protein